MNAFNAQLLIGNPPQPTAHRYGYWVPASRKVSVEDFEKDMESVKMGGYKVYPEYDAFGKPHYLVAKPQDGTLHGFLFYHPAIGWSESKIDSRAYATVESAQTQIALLEASPDNRRGEF